MPVYVYKNLRTNETFEFAQPISEPALSAHPESGDPVKRLIQPVGIAFKGSGFYVTDSRSGNGKASAKPAAGKEAAASSDGAGASSGGSSGGSNSGSSSDAPTSKTDSGKAASATAAD